MIDVFLPYSKVMVAYHCRESPFSEVDEVNHDIVAWLEFHDPRDTWDWGLRGDEVWFRFRDPSMATLFKLTWG